MIDKETLQLEVREDYFNTFKVLPPLLFGMTPNDDYYQLLFNCIKRNEPVTPEELEKVFKVESDNYDLIEEFDEDYEDDITD